LVVAGTHAFHRAPAGFNPPEVAPQVVQLLPDPRLSRFADGNDTNDRRNPDGDSQDSQQAAHLVSRQRHNRRPQKSRVIHSPLTLSDSFPPATNVKNANHRQPRTLPPPPNLHP